MLSITVSDVVAALSTFPGDSEIFLDFNEDGGLALHVHVEYDCYPMWDGETAPETYHPVLRVPEDWEV